MNKLIEIQNELKAPKSQFNSFGKYHYRNVEDILEAVKPLLAKHECTLTLTDEIVEVGGRVYVKATARFADLDVPGFVQVSAYAREPEDKKGMDASQITGAASSYARKYALNGLFLIDDTKDADYTNTHGQEKVVTTQPRASRNVVNVTPDEDYQEPDVHTVDQGDDVRFEVCHACGKQTIPQYNKDNEPWVYNDRFNGIVVKKHKHTCSDTDCNANTWIEIK